MTDLIQIYDKLTEAIADHFVCPHKHKYSPMQSDERIEHERFLTDKDNFKTVISQITEKIPEVARESIWYGISHVKEWKNLSIKKYSDITNMTYIQHDHEMAGGRQKDNYTALPNLWKWLCLKRKIDSGIPTANKWRPLCLLDCLRKLGKILLLRRITSVWDAHNVPNKAKNCRSGLGFSAALIDFQAALEIAQETGSGIFMSSWGIQRAYGSLATTDIKL